MRPGRMAEVKRRERCAKEILESRYLYARVAVGSAVTFPQLQCQQEHVLCGRNSGGEG